METTVELHTSRSEEGRLRVKDINVQLALDVNDDESPTSQMPGDFRELLYSD
jgi:hypothetical protein